MDGPEAVVVRGWCSSIPATPVSVVCRATCCWRSLRKSKSVFAQGWAPQSCDHIAETLKPRLAFLQAPFSPGSPTTGAAHSKAPLSILIGS